MQGKALEYHISSLPYGAHNILLFNDNMAIYEVERQDTLSVWVEYYYYLTESERDKMFAFLIREGIGCLLARISDGK